MMWFDFYSSSDGSTSSGDGFTILSPSNTVKSIWHKTAFHLKRITDAWRKMRDRTPKAGFYTDDFPRRSGRSKYFAYLGTYMLFVEQPVVTLSLYNRVNQWLFEPGWDGQQHLTAPIWKCMSGIGDHWFTFLMDLLSNYTFYTNLTIFSVSRLLIEDVTSMIVVNLWKVEKITQHHLMPVW